MSIFFGLMTYLFLHPIHIGLMQIDFNKKAASLEITQKVFIDDLEAALEDLHQTRLHLGTARENPNADALIEAYIRRHLRLNTPDGRSLSYAFLGKETDMEYVWIYLEVSQIGRFTGLTVQNTILMDWFDDQSHIIRLHYLDQKNAIRVTPAKQRALFEVQP
ncbi:MAG: DUF6702 family protein [Bernardetiaceae bacterium]